MQAETGQILQSEKKRPGLIFLLIGSGLILAALILALYFIVAERRADQAISNISTDVTSVIKKKQKKASEDADQVDPDLLKDRDMPTVTIDGVEYIGELYVPTYKLRLPVISSWSYDNLKLSPCRYTGNLYQGNLVIAGHNYRRHFSSLRWLSEGSEIDFIDAEGNTWKYELSRVEILNPGEVNRLTASSDSYDLTLFTCTVGGGSRYTMRLKRIGVTSAAEEAEKF